MADLLPPNATPAERALAEAVARVGDVPTPLREVWSPDNCPSALLPWLAWAMSVDNWDESWTDDQKRAAIRSSFYVHAHKGTAGALKSALYALGYPITVLEWFEQDPIGTPYTFEVDVEVTDRPIDEAFTALLLRIIWSTKNVRSHLSKLRTILTSRTTLYWAATCGGAMAVTIYPETIKEIENSGKLYFALGQLNTSTVTILPG